MNRFPWAFLMACALPVIACAGPVDAPRADERPRVARTDPDNSSESGGGAAAPSKPDAGADRQGKGTSFTPQEFADTEKFLSENSHHRWSVLKSRGLTHPTRFMVARYKELCKLQSDDADLYNIRVQEIKTDDEIFAQAKLAASDPAAKDRLHKAWTALFDLRVQEHTLHIKKLNELLHAEQEKLDRMNKNRDKIIERNEQDTKKGSLFGPAPSDLDRDRIDVSPSSEPAE